MQRHINSQMGVSCFWIKNWNIMKRTINLIPERISANGREQFCADIPSCCKPPTPPSVCTRIMVCLTLKKSCLSLIAYHVSFLLWLEEWHFQPIYSHTAGPCYSWRSTGPQVEHFLVLSGWKEERKAGKSCFTS